MDRSFPGRRWAAGAKHCSAGRHPSPSTPRDNCLTLPSRAVGSQDPGYLRQLGPRAEFPEGLALVFPTPFAARGVISLRVWLLYSLLRRSENPSVTPPSLWEVILLGQAGFRSTQPLRFWGWGSILLAGAGETGRPGRRHSSGGRQCLLALGSLAQASPHSCWPIRAPCNPELRPQASDSLRVLQAAD